MPRCLHNLLLILVTLSVALAPLRGAWALPQATSIDSDSHCTGMQHDMQQMHHGAVHDGNTDMPPPHKCKSACNGSCCDQGCNACLHAATAIPAAMVVLRSTPVHEYEITLADSYPDRHLKPPLRPPLALH